MAEKIKMKAYIERTNKNGYSILVMHSEIIKLGVTFQKRNPYSNEKFEVTIKPIEK